MTDARLRLSRVLALARLRDTVDATPLPSASNDTWRIGDLVVRVCWRGRVDRLIREAELSSSLPVEVRCPPVVQAGHDGDIAWTVTRHLPGRPVTQIWPSLGTSTRRYLIAQVSATLHALHTWTPPARVHAMLLDHAHTQAATTADIVGLDICPLPVQRALFLAANAAAAPEAPCEPAADAESVIRRLSAADPYRTDANAVVHSDLNFSNILCDNGGQITAVLDFEWARLGAPDQDLEPFLRAVDWAGTNDPEMIQPATMRQILGWIAEDYPHLFAHPRLLDRLRLYQLAYTVRELYTWPAAESTEQLSADHPGVLLRKFAATDTHLRSLLPATA
jgi:aminoglycoside phosphotransferase (APT) family kinase protein